MHDVLPHLLPGEFPALRRGRLETLQCNLGYRCNQSCQHCHVNAGPTRSEQASDEVIELIVAFARDSKVKTLDITGGAPELHPRFRELVARARQLGIHVMDRCNLTILLEPGQQDLAGFLARQRVEVVASLPCYLEENVDSQRGSGVFEKSIAGLRRLNELGYGIADSGLLLNLVYNPQGPELPPPQPSLEQDYKQELKQRYGVEFNGLYTLTNMPIQRFGSMLLSKGLFHGYLETLKAAHQVGNLQGVMCRSLISVDWLGQVYDCDFNQMLKLPMMNGGLHPLHLRDLKVEQLMGRTIAVADHCFGCTAGQGSSCGGALN